MVRLAILLVLVGLSLLEWRRGVNKPLYWLSLVVLGVFFSLRYGQGTDYLTYMGIYAAVPPLSSFPNYLAFQFNKIEIGYFYLNSVFRMLGAHYSIFIAFVTGFGLLSLNRFIRKFCPLPMFALTVFYAVYSITYMESALRQMLTLSIAMGFVFVDWHEGKRLRAIICIGIATLLHTSAAVLIILPVLFWNPRQLFILEWKLRTTLILAVLFAGAAAVVNFVDFTPIINKLPSMLSYTIGSYYEKSGISYLALANRALFMAIVFALAWRAKDRLGRAEKLLFNLYMVGFGLYCMFLRYDLIASRTNVYFRIADVVLIPILFEKNRDLVKKTFVAVPVMMMLLSFLYVKDITAIMDFAGYYGSNPLNYPYVTLFNAETLLDHKFVNVKNAKAMNAYAAGGFNWDDYYESLQRKPQSRSPIVPY